MSHKGKLYLNQLLTNWKGFGNSDGNQSEYTIAYNDDDKNPLWLSQDDCYDFVGNIKIGFFWCLSKAPDLVNVAFQRFHWIGLGMSESPQNTNGMNCIENNPKLKGWKIYIFILKWWIVLRCYFLRFRKRRTAIEKYASSTRVLYHRLKIIYFKKNYIKVYKELMEVKNN